MIGEKWLEAFAHFVVDAACDRFELHTVEDLEQLIAKIIRDELPDMSKLDELPGEIVTAVAAMPGQVIQGVITGIASLVPRWPL